MINGAAETELSLQAKPRLGPVVAGSDMAIGEGFRAVHFSEEHFGGRMDPLLMVDHFVMTGPTFPPHLHAGISAVTAMFEDAEGDFLNRDTLGNNVALRAGDLYWLAAARGAAHEETPAEGARVHALQIFVNLPARLKSAPATALHVQARDMPALEGEGYRVRVMLGRSGGTVGVGCAPGEMTMLDGYLQPGARFSHDLEEDRQAWIYAIEGGLALRLGEETLWLKAGAATTIGAGAAANLVIEALGDAHFVLMDGTPIREPFVKAGPLVMSTMGDVERTYARYVNGDFGTVPK